MPFQISVVEDPRFEPSSFAVDAQGDALLYGTSSSPTSDLYGCDSTDFCPLGPTGLKYREYTLARALEGLAAHPEVDGFMARTAAQALPDLVSAEP